MMRGIYIILMYISFFAVRSVAPFVLSLGYVWVDIFNPQRVARALLQGVPLSLIIAIAAIGAYLVLDRRNPPRVTVVTVFTLLLMGWATLSLSWAVLTDDAWKEWNVVWKTLLFSMFFPFVFRSRIQIQAFLQYICSPCLFILCHLR